jgi:hypothetical protein
MQMLVEVANLLRTAAATQDKAIDGERPLKICCRVKTFIDPVTSLARPITPILRHWWNLYIVDLKVAILHNGIKSFKKGFGFPMIQILTFCINYFSLKVMPRK